MKRIFVVLVALILALGQPARAQQIAGVRPFTTSATLTAADAGTCVATSAGCAMLALGGYTGVAVQVSANASANTLQFEETLDAVPTGSSVWAAVYLNPPASTPTAVNSTTGTGLWTGKVVGSYLRVRMSTLVSGNAVVGMRATLTY